MALKKSKNPVLQKKYEEGFADGYKKGIAMSVDFFKVRFEDLLNVEGIGEKTYQKIVRHLGTQYFKD